MVGFDAELYLRLVGERQILDPRDAPRRSPWGSPLVDIASALVAIDAISVEDAQAIAADYAGALEMRGAGRSYGSIHAAHPGGGEIGAPLPPVRVARGAATVTTTWGIVEVGYVVVTAEVTRLVVTASETGGGGSGMVPILGTVVDDQGNQAPAHFSGGGNGTTYRGHLEAPGLSPTTAWIELDGHRIDLHDVEPTAEVAIEPLPESTAAERHLWSVVTGVLGRGPRGGDPSSVEPTIDVLLAADALPADAAAIREARAVVHAMDTRDLSDPDLPAQWASILSRTTHPFGGGFAEGERRTILLGATIPPLDGVHLQIQALTITGTDVAIDVAASPGSALASWMPALRSDEISWWAEDDRGNHYLGALGSSGGSPGGAEGVVNLVAPLDGAATVLRLLPTARTERAVVHVPLVATEDRP